MATTTTMGAGKLSSSDTVQSIYVAGLRNAHALETEALQIMQRQVERLEHYPEMEQALRKHIRETEGQQRRVAEALHSLGEDRSMIKEFTTGLMGNMAALAHTVMADEIVKNTFANHAFENYEIAAYKSLIAMTEAAGHTQFLKGFEQTLREEQAMAQFIFDNVEAITRKYLMLEQQDEKANR
jgi:ferritin-like metal-binding protein YciE